MAKLHCCTGCFIEMDRVALADGSMVLLCVTCDTIGVEQEIAIGGRSWPAGMAVKPPRRAVKRSRLVESPRPLKRAS